jgi:hypothetical protein
VNSDDPSGTHSIALSGNAPSGTLAVTGSAYFGGVKCCRREFRTITVCNVGKCDLHVTKVAFEHENRHWKLVHNPFPATLHPGSCLNVTIRYHATQKEPRPPCELVIKSDDPVMPVREVEVIAWTRCCCKKCCEQCRAGCCCHEPHKESCDDHRHECCEHHDEERRDGRSDSDRRDSHREEHHHREHDHEKGNEGDGDGD